MKPRRDFEMGLRQRGIALVEFVIVAPILLLLMLGVTEMGRALYQYNTLSKAVRDGARFYSANVFVDGGAAGKSVSLVRFGNTLASGPPILPGPLPTVSASLDGTGNWVTVTASYTFQFLPGNPLSGIMSFFGGSGPKALSFTATTTMRAI
ncbi:TadE/TadG family type IV pilus assembly protein [Methyloterricola oryzae]|uniref:TadE/TadG family type IV pilus assembly protein n=1 Tax=Methyloterricola oryzae TaxID=1495050 RepID=UPI0005EB160A|nr:TadE family protein [Methyloterricola oryzae]